MSKKTILVVDNDQSILTIFEFILSQAGYNVLTASSGDEALSTIQKDSSINLIFLDIKMPGQSGLDTFNKIIETNPLLLVILMTGYNVENNFYLEHSFENGAYGLIYKPFDVEELMAIVNGIFEKRGTQV